MTDQVSPGDRLVVRIATADDLEAVAQVECAAFGGHAEAELVRALAQDAAAYLPELSLLAEDASGLAGHVLFTRARSGGGARAVLLAPLAVVPARQNAGVGSLLVREGLERVRQRGFEVALVLGDPGYYGRFGFTPARAFGILPPYPVDPEEAWMALELVPGALARAAGPVAVAKAFMDPVLWRE